MSLEKALAENTEALRALTIALASSHIPTKAGAAPAAPITGAEAKTNLAAGKEAAAAAANKGAGTATLDYEKDVKPLALRVAKEKGREKLIGVLKEFGVEQANVLKPEQWGEFTKKCNAALTVTA